jgi:hypothetical protein
MEQTITQNSALYLAQHKQATAKAVRTSDSSRRTWRWKTIATWLKLSWEGQRSFSWLAACATRLRLFPQRARNRFRNRGYG